MAPEALFTNREMVSWQLLARGLREIYTSLSIQKHRGLPFSKPENRGLLEAQMESTLLCTEIPEGAWGTRGLGVGTSTKLS